MLLCKMGHRLGDKVVKAVLVVLADEPAPTVPRALPCSAPAQRDTDQLPGRVPGWQISGLGCLLVCGLDRDDFSQSTEEKRPLAGVAFPGRQWYNGANETRGEVRRYPGDCGGGALLHQNRIQGFGRIQDFTYSQR